MSSLASSELTQSNFFDALQCTQPAEAYVDVLRAATWANVPWACVSGMPKFWGLGTMVVTMGVVCVGLLMDVDMVDEQ